MQARIADVLGLHDTDSKVSLDSITSFTSSVDTKKAYKKFCKSLYQVGVTAEMISQKEEEILNIFNSQNTATSSPEDNGVIEDQGLLPEVGDFSIVDHHLYLLIKYTILT